MDKRKPYTPRKGKIDSAFSQLLFPFIFIASMPALGISYKYSDYNLRQPNFTGDYSSAGEACAAGYEKYVAPVVESNPHWTSISSFTDNLSDYDGYEGSSWIRCGIEYENSNTEKTGISAVFVKPYDKSCPEGQTYDPNTHQCLPDCQTPYQKDPLSSEAGIEACKTACPAHESVLDEDSGDCRQPDDQFPNGQCSTEGNPVNYFTGEKIQYERADFHRGGALPFVFERNYRSKRSKEWDPSWEAYAQGGYSAPTATQGRVIYTQPPGYQSFGYQSDYTDPATLVKGFNPFIKEHYIRTMVGSDDIVDENGEVNFQLNSRVSAPDSGYKQWRHNFQYKLRRINETKLEWAHPNGDPILFLNAGTDTYQAVQGQPYTITGNLNDGWLLTMSSGIEHEYDTDGLLKTIRKSEKLFLTFSYDGDYQLTSVAHSLGGQINFTYKENDNRTLIDTVTLPNNVVLTYLYGNLNNVVGIETAQPNGEKTTRVYHYENTLHPYALTGITDENGNRYATWTYDDRGYAISSAHGISGDQDLFRFNYDDELATVVTNPLGKQTIYHYEMLNGMKRLVDVEGVPSNSCAGANRNYTYYGNGLVRTQTDWQGNQTYFEYDSTRGLKTKVIRGYQTEFAQTTEYSWHETFDKPVRIVDGGEVTNITYNEDGNPTEVDYYGVSKTSITYNELGLKSIVDGPRIDVNDLTTYEYTELGLLKSVTNALGHKVEFKDHNVQGLPETLVDANGSVTQYQYDNRGNTTQITQVTDQGNITTVYEYDSVGLLVKVSFADQTTLSFSYDDAYRRTDITNSLGERIHYELDNAGNIKTVETFDQSETLVRYIEQVYDELSRVRRIVGGESKQTTLLEYDVNNQNTFTTDPNGNPPQENKYDVLNRLIEVIDSKQGVTQFKYDSRNRLTHVIDAENKTTEYRYDQFGNTTKLISPDTGVTDYQYDEAGNKLFEADSRGIIASYSYDALNRITSISYPNAPEENITYIYDEVENGNAGLGRLTQINDISGSYKFYYDSVGRLIKKTVTLDNHHFSHQYAYDSVGRLSSFTYPSGRTLQYSYDEQARLNAISTQENTSEPLVSVISNITYLPFGGIKGWTNDIDGTTRSVSYDLDYAIKNIQVSGTSLDYQQAYSYDQNNNIIQLNDLVDSNRSQTFEYDELNRLDFANGTFGSFNYAYDKIGNRTLREQSINGETRTETYVYEDNAHRLTRVESNYYPERVFAYDESGNLQSQTQNGSTRTHQYNDTRRPVSVAVDNVSLQLTYNSFGQRVKKVSGESVQYIHYDHAGNRLSEHDGSGLVRKEYIWLGNQLLGTAVSENTTDSDLSLDMTSPSSDTQIQYGTSLTLAATAENNGEDISTNIQWSSDIQGELGGGATVNDVQLITGHHILTASISNEGAQTIVTRSVQVLSNAAPSISHSLPSYDFINTQVTLNASAQDDVEGDVSNLIVWSDSVHGQLGQGSAVSYTPSLGTHELTLTVTDSLGHSSSVLHTLTIVDSSDSDQDQLPDDWEVQNFGNLQQNGADDTDNDGQTNLEELIIGRNPTVVDSDLDEDEMIDAWEIEHFGDTSAAADGDADGDGLTNLQEFLFQSNPTLVDTDGDDASDMEEFKSGWKDPNVYDTDGDGVRDGRDRIKGSTAKVVAPLIKSFMF